MSKKQDVEKARFSQRVIREAARSDVSPREFCRRRWLHESQFYLWQRRLAAVRSASPRRKQSGEAASFALVSEGSKGHNPRPRTQCVPLYATFTADPRVLPVS